MRSSTFRVLAAALGLIATPIVGQACCLTDDGRGVQMPRTGLAERSPTAPNVSQHPDWSVYRFERDGIQYLQVNHRSGDVELALGKLDDAYWTLPMGREGVLVSLPHQRQHVPSGAGRTLVFSGEEFALHRYGSGADAIWSLDAATAQDSKPVPTACCPGKDHLAQFVRIGLGNSAPDAPDLSLSPGWHVYGFERDGAEYIQINDVAGAVHLVIGKMGGDFWALPAGASEVPIALPHQVIPPPADASRVLVYENPEFKLHHHQGVEDSLWSVETPSSP